jgi:hypothetical protein
MLVNGIPLCSIKTEVLALNKGFLLQYTAASTYSYLQIRLRLRLSQKEKVQHFPHRSTSTSIMALPWTFGLELEFGVGFIYPPPKALPDPTETRKLRFEPTGKDAESAMITLHRWREKNGMPPVAAVDSCADREVYDASFMRCLVTAAIQRDIAETLQRAGFPIKLDDPEAMDPRIWRVTTDDSIEPPEGTGYNFAPIEVISPALEFTPDSLQAVLDVCDLLTTTYYTNVNETTGMHVHVSAGPTETFQVKTLQNLFAFLWAFEPLLDSLHPECRHNNMHCKSLRNDSTLADSWWWHNGQVLTVMQGVMLLLLYGDMEALMECVAPPNETKSMRYNSLNMLEFSRGERAIRTIEFRQHEGTLEADRVVQWIRTVVGIVNFVHTESHISLAQLFRRVSEQDNWTAIDLFKHMRLDAQADFYRSRLHDVTTLPRKRAPIWEWQYEVDRAQGLITKEEHQRQHQMRLVWEQLQTANLWQLVGMNWNFDPNDERWPKHRRLNVSPNGGRVRRLDSCEYKVHD